MTVRIGSRGYTRWRTQGRESHEKATAHQGAQSLIPMVAVEVLKPSEARRARPSTVPVSKKFYELPGFAGRVRSR
jgi:hypothetical protein